MLYKYPCCCYVEAAAGKARQYAADTAVEYIECMCYQSFLRKKPKG